MQTGHKKKWGRRGKFRELNNNQKKRGRKEEKSSQERNEWGKKVRKKERQVADARHITGDDDDRRI